MTGMQNLEHFVPRATVVQFRNYEILFSLFFFFKKKNWPPKNRKSLTLQVQLRHNINLFLLYKWLNISYIVNPV